MLTRLHLQNFTVFADADFQFSPGLNVLVGTNGTGKSHVLKAGYAVLRATNAVEWERQVGTRETHWEDVLRDVLFRVFLPEALHDLSRRAYPEKDAQIEADWTNASTRRLVVEIPWFPDIAEDPAEPKRALVDDLRVVTVPQSSETGVDSVFIPAKEFLSNFAGFVAHYEKREVDFDLTYADLCRHLATNNLRVEPYVERLSELEEVMGGTIKLIGNRFMFQPAGERYPISIHLYAEGLRKFATLWQLIRNGSLTPETTLFWDEPEANLNPQLLRKLARVLATLARNGFQIILATHSLFLLKELHILSRDKAAGKLPIRYFGLNADKPGDAVTVTTEDDFEVLPDIVALDEELEQSGEFLTALNEED